MRRGGSRAQDDAKVRTTDVTSSRAGQTRTSLATKSSRFVGTQAFHTSIDKGWHILIITTKAHITTMLEASTIIRGQLELSRQHQLCSSRTFGGLQKALPKTICTDFFLIVIGTLILLLFGALLIWIFSLLFKKLVLMPRLPR